MVVLPVTTASVIRELQLLQLIPAPPILALLLYTFKCFNLGLEFAIRIPPPAVITVYPLVNDNPVKTEVESSPEIKVAALLDSSALIMVESI